MKRPSFQFYPADWRKDAALQSCSLPARGLWHEMMCLMHECEPYGHLSVNGKPMRPAQVARLVGVTEKEYQKLLAELTDAGVPSVADDGAIYSRRMVRDEHIRNVRAAAGKKGGNPNLVGNKVKQKDNQAANQSGKQSPTPSSSSSSSKGNSEEPSGSSGAAAPPGSPLQAAAGLKAQDALFQVAVPWLVARGMREPNARSLLGGAVKHLGPDDAWVLASECISQGILEPAAWISKSLNERIATAGRRAAPAAGINRQEALEARNREVARRLAAEGSTP